MRKVGPRDRGVRTRLVDSFCCCFFFASPRGAPHPPPPPYGPVSLAKGRRVGGEGGQAPMFPVRCYTCNAVLAQHAPEYVARTNVGGDTAAAVLADLGIRRMCCRRMFLGYVDTTTDMLRYPNVDLVMDGGATVLRRNVRFAREAPCD